MPLIINGQRIEDAVLENETATIKAYHENLGNVSCCERDPEFRATAKDNIVARVLLAQEAKRSQTPTADEEVEAALAKLLEEYGGKDWFLMRTGATEEQMPLVRHDLDIDLRVRRMLDSLADELPQPSEATLRQHYEDHLKVFMTTEEVRASHILKNPQGEQRGVVFDELREIRKQLLAGSDFHEMAQKHSEKAEDSIDLGFFKQGELAPEFEAVAFSLKVGEISPIFVTQYGMHIITVTEHKPAVPKPFDEVRELVQLHWRELQKNEKTKQLVEKLKETAQVEEIDPELEAAQAMS